MLPRLPSPHLKVRSAPSRAVPLSRAVRGGSSPPQPSAARGATPPASFVSLILRSGREPASRRMRRSRRPRPSRRAPRRAPQDEDVVLLNHVRQQPEEAGALDGLGEFALLLRRHRGDAARHDLAALGHVTLQQLHVLIVDLRRIGARERAGLATAEERPTGATALRCECHRLLLHTCFFAIFTAPTLAARAVAAVTAIPITP